MKAGCLRKKLKAHKDIHVIKVYWPTGNSKNTTENALLSKENHEL